MVSWRSFSYCLCWNLPSCYTSTIFCRKEVIYLKFEKKKEEVLVEKQTGESKKDNKRCVIFERLVLSLYQTKWLEKPFLFLREEELVFTWQIVVNSRK